MTKKATKPKKGKRKGNTQTLEERGLKLSPGREAGRPKGRFLPKYKIDWEMAEAFYVTGMIVREVGKGLERRKPSYRDVAERFEVSKTAIQYQAKKRNWQKKREKYDNLEKEAIQKELAKARAYSFADGEAILDLWIKRFEEGLANGDVRTDSISDLERAYRTKAFLRGQVERRVEVKGGLTLETLQREHKEIREAEEIEDAELAAGVLVAESVGHDGDGEGGSPLH